MSRAFYLGGLSAALLLCLGTFAEAGLFGNHHRADAGCCAATAARRSPLALAMGLLKHHRRL